MYFKLIYFNIEEERYILDNSSFKYIIKINCIKIFLKYLNSMWNIIRTFFLKSRGFNVFIYLYKCALLLSVNCPVNQTPDGPEASTTGQQVKQVLSRMGRVFQCVDLSAVAARAEKLLKDGSEQPVILLAVMTSEQLI